MLIGHMRVSTGERSLDLQRDALDRIGCERVYEDVCSGRTTERPGLNQALHVAHLVTGKSGRGAGLLVRPSQLGS